MDSQSAQRYAKTAGILIVVSSLAGAFGESYVPGRLLVANNAAETAHRMVDSIGLFRASFAAYLIEAMCDLTLTAIFYILLRPVSRPLSLIAVCFGIFGTATFAVGEIFYFAAAWPVINANVARTLTPDASAAFISVCLTMYGYVFSTFTAMYGIPVMLRGYLILRSGYLPRALGGIVLLGGAGFVIKNIVVVLAPQYDSNLFVLPLFLAMASMAFWLLVKGIDRARWERMEQAQ
jgi:hypothetical protein